MILALKDTETYNAIFPILSKEKKDRHNIDFIINIITNNGFIEKAKQILYQKLDNAINDLNKLPDNIYRHALCKTVSFLKDF
jgi:geranylgeranyl pyrophosphate synthase